VKTSSSELPFVLRRLDHWVQRGLARPASSGGEPVRELHLELTHRCDSRCLMCHHWLLAEGHAGEEMSLEEIGRLVEGSRLLSGVETVVLSGGEPLLRPDAPQIAALLARRFPKARIGVLSNMLDEKRLFSSLERMRSLGVRPWLGTSLDGMRKNHDRLRGRPGAFYALIRNVVRLRRELPDVELGFCFTLTPFNYTDLGKARVLARSLGCDLGAQFVVDHEGFEAPERFHWTPAALRGARAQIQSVLSELCREGRALERILEGRESEDLGLWTKMLYWRHLGEFAGGASACPPKRAPKRVLPDCLAGRRYAMFDPQGRLFFCPVNKHRKVGSAAGSSFDELWTSSRARAERRFIDSGRCACWLQCTAYPALERVLRAAFAKGPSKVPQVRA
jgi:MoaA/NifB/PqqE/SkfB family radical SAM enzyme